jgi:hypothetical protein
MTDEDNRIIHAMMARESKMELNAADVSDNSSTGTDSDGLSTSHGAGTTEVESPLAIAKEENSAVNVWRIVTFMVLVMCTFGVVMTTYFFVGVSEEEEFELTYEANSARVFESFASALNIKLGAIDAFVVAMASYASASKMSWPFVIIPDHAIRAAKMRSLSNSLAIQQYALVKETQRDPWETFAAENNGWVQESIEFQRNDWTYNGNKIGQDGGTILSTIHFDEAPLKPNSGR